MKVTKELIKKIYDIIEKTVINAVNSIYNYQKNNSYVPVYYKYPTEFLKGIEQAENYEELKEKVPAFKYGIKFYTTTNYDAPKKYGELLQSSDGNFSINIHNIEGFEELVTIFKENEEAMKMLASEEKYLDSSLISFIRNIVNRYLYVTKKFESGEIDTDIVIDLIQKQLIRYFHEQLAVTICVPICLLGFESDEINIAENITISRMSKEFQISRFNARHFESTQEAQFVQCASFVAKFKGYSITNKEKESLQNATTNYWTYPQEIIDDLFAAIRIAVGFKTGYGQLLIEPCGWAGEWTTDLVPLYGANVRAFNRKEIETKLFGYDIRMVTDKDVELVKELFAIIREKKADEKNNKQFKKVFIAIQRLNRCMLREEYDDTALDAIIGIETLLSGDMHGEITYTISNRISVVAAKLESCPYSPADARKAMKVIYGLRSDIVHGRSIGKNKTVKINDSEIETMELAVEFLRYALLFVMKNQEYLEVKNYEAALDMAVKNSN